MTNNNFFIRKLNFYFFRFKSIMHNIDYNYILSMELSAHVATAITMQYTHVHVFMLFVIV